MNQNDKCSAHNRQGRQCGRPRVPGASVCYMHGGAAPQVLEAARARLRAAINPAIGALIRNVGVEAPPAVQVAAAKEILNRNEGLVDQSSDKSGCIIRVEFVNPKEPIE